MKLLAFLRRIPVFLIRYRRYSVPVALFILGILVVNNVASYALCYAFQRARYSTFAGRDQVAEGCSYHLTFPFGY
jgi:hypothetical protein